MKLKKLWIVFRSGIIFLYSKFKYGNRFKCKLINTVSGKLKINIENKGSINISSFLMSDGPLYLKAIENGKLNIGKRVYFNHNCSVTCINNISIGDYTCIANNVVIVDHDHVLNKNGVTAELRSKPIIINSRVWIGANVVITAGVHIGEGAVIAAGAVVVNDVSAHTLVAGVPARFVKKL